MAVVSDSGMHLAGVAGDGTRQHRPAWSPYDNNGGTVIAIAGDDYCIVAGSTRLSTGYSILARDHSKILKLHSRCVVASSGFAADMSYLQKMLKARHVIYAHEHSRPMSCKATSQMLSNTLYYRRFFPLYTFNLCAGLDEEGRGAVYTYDAIGSFERCGYSCQGSGKDLIQPLLDHQLKAASPLLVPQRPWMTSLSAQDALELVKDAFTAATERDIYTGDAVEIVLMDKDGMKEETLQLKKD